MKKLLTFVFAPSFFFFYTFALARPASAQTTITGSTVITGGAGGGGASGLATYAKIGTVAGGVCYVSPYVITTDAFAAMNACSAQLPAAGGVIDATALATANYTVTTPLTALNNASQGVTLVLNQGTTFTINTSFATPTNSPASAAVAVGNNSAIITPGGVPLHPNFLAGSSAKVWDLVSNGNFTGTQQTLRLDGVQLEGNPAASISGALLHVQGVVGLSRISNSSTQLCYAQCVELDAGTPTTTRQARMLLDGDFWTDGAVSGTYPGSVLKMDALSSAGALGNIVFEGGEIGLNGPHNYLLAINGRGGLQLNSIAFFNTQLNTAAATASSANPNVDPIQIVDASQIYFNNLHSAGFTTSSAQPNLVDISQTVPNLSFGINLNQVSALASAGFTCLINNTIEGTCEAGYPTGSGIGNDIVLPDYAYGQLVPQVRQTTTAPPATTGQCVVGSIWTNSSGTSATNTIYVCEGNPGSQSYQPIGGGGSGGGIVESGSAYQLGEYPASGTTIGPAPNVYALTPQMTLAQVNSLFSGLQSTGGNVVIPDGVQQFGWTNTSVQTKDWRKGADWLQISRYGIACDAAHYYVTLTSGSNQVNVGSFFGAEAVGKYMVFGYKSGLSYGATQASWTAQITGYTYPNATLSANAPFNFTGFASFGTDNSANLQTALNDAGFAFPLSIPSGCQMLTLKPLQWNNGQSIVGRAMGQGGFVGVPGQDILQQPDASGGGNATTPGVRLENLSFGVDSSVDASLGYTSYSATGAATTVPALYRPLHTHMADANDPLAPGWMTGASNGVASIAQNSAVICYSTASGQKAPAVGQVIVFPYQTAVFTSTVSSLSGGGCSGATAPATLAAAFPNTSGYTSAQAEFFAGSAVQSTTTSIPANPTLPLTITLTLPIQPVPGFESNFATHGHVKFGNSECDYMGVGGYSTNVITLRKCNAIAGYSGTTTIVPLNPCPAKNLFGSASDQPWPVTPSLNSGDSTPAGANWFPGLCGGNAAISFPEANANTYFTTGLSNSFLENLQFNVTSTQLANNTIAIYTAGNTSPYGVDIGGLQVNYLTYGYAQGPASAGQHGIGPAGPTATGNTFHNWSIHAAYPMSFADMQQSSMDRADTYSTEISPYDGTAVGAATCLTYGYTLDEQTGKVLTNTSQDSLSNWNCEPENGSHIEVPPFAELDGFSSHFSQDDFEGSFTVAGGGQQKFENGQMALPVVNYGQNNDFQDLGGLTSSYTTNVWSSTLGQFYNWGESSNCSNYAGGTGPLVNCGAGFAQGYSGHSAEAAAGGNILGGHPYENALGGQINPGEWNTSGSLDPYPMSVGFTVDPTEPYWGSYAACNLTSSTQCQPNHFDGFGGYIFIGPHNRVVDGSYVLVMDVKTVSASSSVAVYIAAYDSGSGQCGTTGIISSSTVAATTSWTPTVIGPFSFSGRAGCTFSVQFGPASTTDQLRVGYFDLVPVPQWQLLQVATFTQGAACTPNGTLLGSDTTNLYMCAGGQVQILPFGGGGGGGSSAFAALTSGTNTTMTSFIGSGASLGTSGTGTIAATSATTAAGPTGSPTLCSSGQAATGVGASFAAQGCTVYLQGSLSANSIPVATGPAALTNSLATDDGHTFTYTGSGGMQVTSATPGKIALLAGTGSIPALPNNSAGFAAPATGGTPYLVKMPSTVTAGFAFLAAPATGDGVNESVLSSQSIDWNFPANTFSPGDYATGNVIGSSLPAISGHVHSLSGFYVQGTCTTPPIIQICDVTTTTCSATLTLNNTGQATTGPLGTTVPFAAGDLVQMKISTAGSGCSGGNHAVSAEMIAP